VRWLLLAFLTFVLSGIVTAQEETFIARTFDASNFVKTLQEEAETYNETLTNIGRALAALGLVASIVVNAFKGTLHATAETLLRALVVSGLLWIGTDISNLTYDTWESTRSWSMSRLQDSFDEGAEEIAQLGEDSALLLMMVSAPAAYAGAVGKSAVTAGVKANAEIAKNFARWANIAIAPVVFFVIIVHLVILLTGLTIAIVNLILPIAVGMLMFSPANGERWLGNYVGSAITAILVVALMPMGFKAAFDLAVVGPVTTVNENFSDFDEIVNQMSGVTPPPRVRDIDAEAEALLQRIGELSETAHRNGFGNASMDPSTQDEFFGIEERLSALRREHTAVSESWYEGVARRIGEVISGAFAELRNWLLRLLLLVVGASFGSYMLWHVSRGVSGAVGGMALSGIQIMTSPMKALAGKEGAGRLPGGGGGRDYGGPGEGRALPSGTTTASGGPKAIGAGPSQGGGRPRSRT
jgi:hypothetical protein